MKHMHKKHNEPKMYCSRKHCGVKRNAGEFLIHRKHRASHRLNVKIYRRHYYPQVSGSVESHLWVLANKTVYLSYENHRKTNYWIEKCIQKILSIKVSAA